MSVHITKSNVPYDKEIIDIVDYVLNYEIVCFNYSPVLTVFHS